MFVLVIALALFPLQPKFFREANEGNIIRKFSLMGVALFGLILIALTSRG
jgi:hypothetical protein